MKNIKNKRIRHIIKTDYLDYLKYTDAKIIRLGDLLDCTRFFLEGIFSEENLQKLENVLAENGLYLKSAKKEKAEKKKQLKIEEKGKSLSIYDVGFSVRVINSLKEQAIENLYELACLPKQRVSKFWGLGNKGLNEVENMLKKYELNFKTDNRNDFIFEDEDYFDYEYFVEEILKSQSDYRHSHDANRLEMIDEILIPMENRSHEENLDLIKSIVTEGEFDLLCYYYWLTGRINKSQNEYAKEKNLPSSGWNSILNNALQKLCSHKDVLISGEKLQPYYDIYKDLVFAIKRRSLAFVSKEDLLNALLSRSKEENLSLIESVLNEREYVTICNKYSLVDGKSMPMYKIAAKFDVHSATINKDELNALRALGEHVEVLLTGQPLVTDEVLDNPEEIIYTNLTKNFKSSGLLETLEKLPARYFEKYSQTMETISKRATDYIKTFVDDAVKNNTYSQDEEKIDKLMEEYKDIIDKKRTEYEIEKSEQEKENFTSKMKAKLGDLKKYHHKAEKHMEGHKRNPFADDIEME